MQRGMAGLVGVVLAWASVSAAQTAPTVAGHWEGAISVPTGGLTIVVDFDRAAAGSWVGELDIPEQQAENVPLARITVSGESISFDLSLGPASARFEGKLSADGQTMSGTFTQAGNSYPFSLKRTGPARLHVPAKMAPLPDRFLGTWEGTLTAPAGTLRIVLHFANKDGAGSGTMDSPDQGATGLALTEISVNQNAISARLSVAGASLSGKLSDDGKTLSGSWMQGGQTLTLTAKKAGQ